MSSESEMPTDFKTFCAILADLLSPDNNVRTKAEALYDEINATEKLFLLLTAVASNEVAIEEAELAAILLRRLLSNEFTEAFCNITVDTTRQIKNQLLHRIQQDVNRNLRRRICDAIAELARKCVDEAGNNHWPEFLKFLFDSACSQDPVLREMSLLMFSAVPGIFGNQQSRYIDVIHQMLTQSLSDQSSEDVRYAAVKATTSFILTHEKEVLVQKQFGDCVNLLLAFLDHALDDINARPEDILRYIIDLVETCPQYFRAQLDLVMQICLKGSCSISCSESCRILCLEVVVTLTETAPGMIRKLGSKHLPSLISIIFKMMTDIEDDDNWRAAEEEEDTDNDSMPIVGESCLDRLACSLGGKTLLPLVLNSLPHMLNSNSWKERYAGMMIISAIGEGCHTQMSALLPQIVDGLLPFLLDINYRVRYATCNAFGQMASDFAPVFQKKFHVKVIPALLQSIADNTCPRVQAHAGAALVNFFEDCPKNILVLYMDSICGRIGVILKKKLDDLVEKGTKLVLEQLVVTLASLADTVEERFTNYYERFMPYLKFIIQNAIQPDFRVLRGKTIECVSLIGLAVGKEKFLADASEVMDLLLKTQTNTTPIADDDPQVGTNKLNKSAFKE
ncbi:importin-5-like [Stegodyphus dumicola]|uniref:importin-5-like n=1 Tax=Stegodyphus dumicola TaxID=202533 RepID=UPI0015AC9284|nr:importin-5-like [Stegodyphus dumicola]